jgi:undecaprenyl-phosphate 4-deoxy-4-formamido-L-arabinose transferase
MSPLGCIWPQGSQGPADAGRGRLDLSVVVPACNESANIPELLARITAAVAPLGSYEIVVVDDGSTDDSWSVLQRAADADPHIVGVRLQRNFGQHPALTAGLTAARGEVMVTLDADLQNPPEEIPKLVARLGPDCDVASGWRQMRRDSWLRRLPSKLVNVVLRHSTGVYLHDYGCMMRAYRRRVIELLLCCPEVSRATTGLVSWLGVQIVEVPIAHEARRAGRSRYRFWRLLRMNFDILTGFSTGVLQLVSVSGIVVSVLGFAAAIVLVVWRITHGAGPVGLTTFLAVLMFLAGMQVAAIGIVGEYVGRIFTQVQGRPYYVVRETIGEGREVSGEAAEPAVSGEPAVNGEPAASDEPAETALSDRPPASDELAETALSDRPPAASLAAERGPRAAVPAGERPMSET